MISEGEFRKVHGAATGFFDRHDQAKGAHAAKQPPPKPKTRGEWRSACTRPPALAVRRHAAATAAAPGVSPSCSHPAHAHLPCAFAADIEFPGIVFPPGFGPDAPGWDPTYTPIMPLDELRKGGAGAKANEGPKDIS